MAGDREKEALERPLPQVVYVVVDEFEHMYMEVFSTREKAAEYIKIMGVSGSHVIVDVLDKTPEMRGDEMRTEAAISSLIAKGVRNMQKMTQPAANGFSTDDYTTDANIDALKRLYEHARKKNPFSLEVPDETI